MAKKKSYPTFTDQFCGGGGSSLGAKKALLKAGAPEDGIKLALNHWKLAIEAHSANFPQTLHDCTDISACDPRRYPSTDVLITSPECTNHSLAKGQKAVRAQLDMFEKGKLDASAERSRATMWDVPRFAEYHNYNVIIVENVVDARRWVMFDSWLHAMRSLGYLHKCVYFNSQHSHPTPQSRDRMYVVFWKKGNKAPNLDIHPRAWCPRCEKDVDSVQTWKDPRKPWGKYRQQYIYSCPSCAKQVEPYYYASFNCIDWSIPGKRIGDRKKPLAENTMKRIRYGWEKYGKMPLFIMKSNGRAQQNRTPATQGHTGIGFPFIIENFGTSSARSAADRLGAVTANGNNYGVVNAPMFVQLDHAGLGEKFGSYSGTNPLNTQTTADVTGVVMPYLTVNYSPGYSRSLSDTFGTCTATDHHGLVSSESFRAFLQYYYNGSNVLSGIHEPGRTVTTKERASLVNIQHAERVEDCTYRMLVPHEIQRAMAFDDDYRLPGTAKEKVKLLGNAVTPPVMELLVERVLETFK